VASLERLAADARSAYQRVDFDDKLADAYTAAGTPERAIPVLERSEREFPFWYLPPARLSRVHLALGHLDEAEAAVERARRRVSGIASLEVLALAADVAHARGDVGSERFALAQAVGRTARARLSPERRKLRDQLRERLDALPR
jgi:hypothetical protein